MKRLYRIAKLGWIFLTLCVLAYCLYFNFRGWETFSVCYLGMGVLSFPLGTPVVRGILVMLYQFSVPVEVAIGVAPGPIIALWCLMFAVGWLQWFWLLPRLLRLLSAPRAARR